MEEEGEALSSLPGEHALLAVLRRHAATGELPSWIHEESVYSDSPFVLTAHHEKATAADGAAAWYFLYTRARKEGTSSRYSRTAGGATWVEERTRPVHKHKVDADGKRIQMGYTTTFSYAKRTKGTDGKTQTQRLGWILVETRLPDGHLCCAKLYPSPRNPPAAPLEPALVAPPAPALVAPPPAPALVAPPPAPALVAPPAPALVAPPAPALVTPPTPALVAPAPAAVGEDTIISRKDAEESTPQGTKWVKVRISSSPVKSPCYSKEVFEIEDEANPPKRRLLNCKAWLSINHLDGIA